ncbi:hypothetical protein F0562_014318 [Nyssa sinensis]|uniref:Uncharacterized protein n=1 Tax=Nyssa sinensis TaxID=561372 RepID=A0A5J4ZRK1_9ASTE|nr:hypothetical protein F0562_014318 [Nyssa sinensis]
MQDYEKEREARELLEEACNELAKKIVEDKAEVEALKSESIKIFEEVEEERKMLQMAEVWREERVQMKLVDVKLILEEKYCQLNNLIADLETFLKSRDVTMDTSEAKVIEQAASSVNFQDIKEFSYMPPKSDDIYSRIEELQNAPAKRREIDQCLNSSPSSHASEILGANLEGSQRLSNGSDSHIGTISPERGSGQTGLGRQDLLEPRSSPDSGNPHITRGDERMYRMATRHPEG